MTLRSWVLVVALLSIPAIAIAASSNDEFVLSADDEAARRPPDWPPFRMVFAVYNGPGREESMVWGLVYASARDWTKTLLQDPRGPMGPGSTERFVDETLTITHAKTLDPQTGELWKLVAEHPGEVVVPNGWMRLNGDIALRTSGYVPDEDNADQTLTFRVDSTSPCNEDLELVIPACEDNDVYRSVTETVYTTAVNPPLPVSLTVYLEAEPTLVVEVIDLTVTINRAEIAIR